MTRLRIGIIGAGKIARIRAQALLNTARVELCGVATSRIETAQAFAAEFSIAFATDNYCELLICKPHAVLIEVPHQVQDQAVLWALQHQLHVLLGSCLATTSAIGREIVQLAKKQSCIVECGYEARYKPCWHYVKEKLESGSVGTTCLIRAVALWEAPGDSWYYQQAQSGGMPVTHMSYAFLNPLRWLFGWPHSLSAMSNRIKQTQTGYVDEESCIVNMRFASDILMSLTAGYVTAPTQSHWQVEILGTAGMLDIYPGDLDAGSVRLDFPGTGMETVQFLDSENAFNKQAQAFVQTVLEGQPLYLNPPEDAIHDIQLAEAIVRSAHMNQVIYL